MKAGKDTGSSSKCAMLCSSDEVLKNILSEVQEFKTCMISRLTSLELKVSALVTTCNKITTSLDSLQHVQTNRQENITGSSDQNDNVSSNTSLMEDTTMSVENTCNDSPEIANYMPVVPQKQPDTFQSSYGLTKTQFEGLLVCIGEHYKLSNNKLPVETASLACLWTLCNQDSYRNIGDRFGICKGTIANILHTFTHLVSEHLEHCIEWPRGKVAENTIAKFSNLGFPNTLGAIDACHIQIDRPSEADTPCPDNYYNRKSFYSTNLLAVCNPNLEFTFVHVGSPGKFPDSKVLNLSELGEAISENPYGADIFPKGTFLIGDSAFPLSVYIMTPFREYGHVTETEIIYNRRLSSARKVVKRGLSLLKSRFRRLKHLQMHTLASIAIAIKTCCILHNICIEENDSEYHLEEDEEEEFEDNEYCGGGSLDEKKNKAYLHAIKLRYETAASL